MRRQLLTIILAAGAVAGLHPREAEACASRMCIPGEVGPRAGQSIPANAALIYVPTDHFSGGSGGTDARLSLTMADGTPVPFTTSLQAPEGRDVVITPTSLEPGADYVLRYVETCESPEWGEGEPNVVEVPFTASRAAGFPSSAGTLSIEVARSPDFVVGAGGGSCVALIEAVVATLTVSPSEELRPLLPVTRWRVEVDGKHWSTSAWGGITSEGRLVAQSGNSIPLPGPTAVHSLCSTSNPMVYGGVPTGAHHVTVIPEIAGQGRLPAFEADIVLECPATLPDGGTQGEMDGGNGPGPSDGGTQGGTDGGDGDGSTPFAFGCGSTGLDGVGLLALALAPFALRWRRRSALR